MRMMQPLPVQRNSSSRAMFHALVVLRRSTVIASQVSRLLLCSLQLVKERAASSLYQSLWRRRFRKIFLLCRFSNLCHCLFRARWRRRLFQQVAVAAADVLRVPTAWKVCVTLSDADGVLRRHSEEMRTAKAPRSC
mmetsp:Transcript_64634/g.114973  ORF Transcript_64634/g.114973 Transcript_64634/m.114973 type:complete len:136 (-) Transcript_64634:47-454(-)